MLHHTHNHLNQFVAGFVTASMFFTIFAVVVPSFASYNIYNSTYNQQDADLDGISNGYDSDPFNQRVTAPARTSTRTVYNTTYVGATFDNICNPALSTYMSGICGALCAESSCASTHCTGHTKDVCELVDCSNPCNDESCPGYNEMLCSAPDCTNPCNDESCPGYDPDMCTSAY